MNFQFKTDCDNISWEEVPRLLEKVGMAHVEADKHRISFEASYAVIFVFDQDKLIGLGRMISDGIRQSALYDIAVDPEYQGQKIGREIVQRLMATTPDCNFILYASPGKEDFYKKLNFRKMKTGMILFSNPDRMRNNDFVEE